MQTRNGITVPPTKIYAWSRNSDFTGTTMEPAGLLSFNFVQPQLGKKKTASKWSGNKNKSE